ncbi:MAG: 6-phosphofructokinase [Clostridia bacterium]|nr:6-phosphofructokinase [Clostridia bacterium]
MKRIGVLTSGGDAPGMNAAIRAVVRSGIYYGLEVIGIHKGYNGLIHGDYEIMSARSVSDILHRGGTILQTARCLEFKEKPGIQKAYHMAKEIKLDGMVVIGGDGSFRGARDLSLAGLPTIGIPATIDNDIACTDYCIGFDTALNTARDAIDKIRDTARSHERCSVVEVMGRDAGYIAVYVAMACGAEAAIIPEEKYDYVEDTIKKIKDGMMRGKAQNLIIVAEGVGGSVELAKKIEKETGIETRATILGHIQRGGGPTVRDRINASRMGIHAVKLLKDGVGNRVVAKKKDSIVDYDILEGLNMTKSMESELLECSKILSM